MQVFEKSLTAFKTIREVSVLLDLPPSVLRFWETQFPHIQPCKMKGKRRYYRPQDIAALKHIKSLLYTEGYTIKGARQYIRGKGKNVMDQEKDLLGDDLASHKPRIKSRNKSLSLVVSDDHGSVGKQKLIAIKSELVALRDLLAPYI